MRFAIYFLAFVNVVLLVLATGVTQSPHERSGGEAGELSPGRIRIVSRGDPPPAPVEPIAVASPPPAVATAGEPPACAEWRDLTHAQADRLALASEASGILLTREVTSLDSSRWWVHIPPSPNGRAGAEKKLAELRKLGVKRFSLVEDAGEHRYAISFGRFNVETEAQKTLDALRQKGVRSARLVVEAAGDGRERLIARGPGESIAALRNALVEVPFLACDPPGGADKASAAKP